MMFGQSLDSHRISKRLAKALTRLRVCAGWSEPLLVMALIFFFFFLLIFFHRSEQNQHSQPSDESDQCIRGPMGPGSLNPVLVMRRGCLPQNINPISATPKSVLVITRIITISYQVNEFNQNILICTIVMSGLYALYPTQRPWSCIRVSKGAKICRSNFRLHNDLNFFPCILICNMTLFRTMFDLLTLSRGRGCVKEQNICWHVIVLFFSVCR